jgi:hypothetical protein
VNADAAKILIMDESFKVYDNNLSGLKCLWEILLKSENSVILENAIELFSACHLKYGHFYVKKEVQRQYQEKMTLECINMIKKGYKSKNINLIKRTI